MNEPDTDAVIASTRREGAATIVAVRGEIDLHNSPLLRSALLECLRDHKPRDLVLNLGQVRYMDSSAIAVLVEALQKLRREGGRIHLTDLQPRVRGLLEIARLDRLFNVVATEKDALSGS